MDHSDEGLPGNISGSYVRAKIDHLWPVAWANAQRCPDGTRSPNTEWTEVSALPPELTTRQTNLLALEVIAGVLEESVLLELHLYL
jgi:hypothetical protein